MASLESKAMNLSDLALGFHLPDVDLGSLDYRELIHSKSDWSVVAGIILACREGNFEFLKDVHKVMQRNDGYLLWSACINIVGYAGTWESVVNLSQHLSANGGEAENAHFIAVLFGTSCDLRAVDKLLHIYMTTKELDTLNQIRADLSSLLEPTNGEVFDGIDDDGDGDDMPSRDGRERYSQVVRKRRDAVLATLPDSRPPVFEGQIYSVIATARRLLEQIEAEPEYGERFFRGKMIFEAATGTDCSGFFDELGRLRRIQASAVLEGFFDREDLNKYQVGQRYFFNYPIPS
ncbi:MULTISPECIES: hypothetical protein [Mesorhizobium]|nr:MULTISPECIES: hypothetical protein [Mesorhizobium]RUX94411.1 hypothetical protein EN993_15715 [Mesorhizobium sp. M7D.F.Ca.US.004.01.2.1]RVA33899.1 hypothetical protein EN935_08070 [Mesorhizobium sp. M7D.F.Ca.US.004.03.1.1]